jgi:hypothetical protein
VAGWSGVVVVAAAAGGGGAIADAVVESLLVCSGKEKYV